MAKKKSKVKAKAKKSKAAPAKKKAAKRSAAKAQSSKTKSAKAKKAKPAKAKKSKPVKAAARKPAPAKKKKQIVGEGDYAATRAFDKDQANFVKRNKAKIPAMGKAAEAALDGPEGDALRAAEASAADRSRDRF